MYSYSRCDVVARGELAGARTTGACARWLWMAWWQRCTCFCPRQQLSELTIVLICIERVYVHTIMSLTNRLPLFLFLDKNAVHMVLVERRIAALVDNWSFWVIALCGFRLSSAHGCFYMTVCSGNSAVHAHNNQFVFALWVQNAPIWTSAVC